MFEREYDYGKYKLEVYHNSEDYEAVKFTANRGPGKWSTVELFPEEIARIITEISEGSDQGQFGSGSDYALNTNWMYKNNNIAIIQNDTAPGTKHSVAMKYKHFKEVAEAIAPAVAQDPLGESYIDDILNAL